MVVGVGSWCIPSIWSPLHFPGPPCSQQYIQEVLYLQYYYSREQLGRLFFKTILRNSLFTTSFRLPWHTT